MVNENKRTDQCVPTLWRDRFSATTEIAFPLVFRCWRIYTYCSFIHICRQVIPSYVEHS